MTKEHNKQAGGVAEKKITTTQPEQQVRTERRKNEHIDIVLEKKVGGELITTGFEKYRLIHKALPEIDFHDISINTEFLGRKLKTPFLISSMTGGTSRAWEINKSLAEAAEQRGWAMGLGSMRAAVENEAVAYSFDVRSIAPSIPIIANLGAVQFNYGYDVEQCKRVIEIAQADGLVLHLNGMQEVFQPEGDTNFSRLLPKIEKVVKELPVPVGVKEVGWGISEEVAQRLSDIGIQFIDVAGAGGTSWSQVEKYRAKDPLMKEVAQSFSSWGIPTAECITAIQSKLPELPLIASGGISNGIDTVKSMILGARLVGFGRSILRDAVNSTEKLEQRLRRIELECQIAMFGIGVRSVMDLKNHPALQKEGES